MDFALYGSNTAIDSTVCTAKSATGKKLGVFEGFCGLREAEGCLPYDPSNLLRGFVQISSIYN